MVDVTPVALATHRHRTVIDVRGMEERAALGWVPGSLWRPPAVAAEGGWLSELADEEPIAIVCNSGRRSKLLVEELRGRDVRNLAGGFLAWRAADLPYVPPLEDEPEVGLSDRVTRERFQREMLACFIGSAAQSQRLDPVDAAEELELVMADLDGTSASAHRVIERLASIAWRAGVPLDVMVRNIQHFFVRSRGLVLTPV